MEKNDIEVSQTDVEGRVTYFVSIGFRTKSRSEDEARQLKQQILETKKLWEMW